MSEQSNPVQLSPSSTHQMELVKMWSTIFMSLATVVIVPLMISMNGKLSQYGDRLTRIETWMGEGRRYTAKDAEKDYGVIARVLSDQGLELADHETRIRSIESKQRQGNP